MKNRKFKAMFFSIIPGAGHMYLNLPKQGVQLMGLFFLTLAISGWLNLGILGIISPIIWFYSFFDAGYKATLEQPIQDGGLEIFNSFSKKDYLSKDLNKILGYGLIIIGIIALVERTVFPLLVDLNLGNTFRSFLYSFRSFIRTGLVSAILIIVGSKLLSGSKINTKE
ncbi:hypothetical protein NBE98_16065 [Clostridium swellfunianum]|uniref:hypothetical protein n=1 Tax=Clostridium swellfunianum TaxID=1367462 RepID=UPI00202DD321|nr:hypothetical protein [Clostridium swellfunianum]MCM0649883.1 hypothetical protein [Clostridium swellfunianum]